MLKKVHFVGIGGAGMAPLAKLLSERGCRVSGSDLVFNAKCRELEACGAEIFTGHKAENMPPDCELLVRSSAAAMDNPEVSAAVNAGIPVILRGGLLAKFAENYRRTVSVSGTHGKSSISSLLSSILVKCGLNPGFMIGAQVSGFPSCANGAGDDIFVTEADESDGTHTLLKNELGIVPNIEDDHAWSLGGSEQLEKNFRTFAANSRQLIYYASPMCDKLFADHHAAVRLEHQPEEFENLSGFQAANAYIAYRAAVMLGCDEASARKAAGEYPQVLRRMTEHFRKDGLCLIEDYAHHPTEVKRAIEWLRNTFPNSHLRIVFQPHRHARLERYFDDFANVLSASDSLFVTPVFAAWCETGKFSGADLAAAADGCALSGTWDKDAEIVTSNLADNTVIAVFGAGDVEEIIPHIIHLL